MSDVEMTRGDKARATRAANRSAAIADRRRTHYEVNFYEEYVTTFRVKDGATAASIARDLVENFGPHPDPEDCSTFGGVDMVVWHDNRIVAVVRKGDDGKPEAHIFDGSDRTE